MLSAIKLSDNTKVVGNDINKDKTEGYICPSCLGIVVHHKSNNGSRIGHFKHKKTTKNCINSKESRDQIECRYQMFKYLKDYNGVKKIEIEKIHEGINIRSGIFIETNKGTTIVINILTSQKVDDLLEIFEYYNRMNFYMLWVIPYKNSSFYETGKRMLYDETTGEHNVKTDTRFKGMVKLKANELLIYWSSYKSLIFWDNSNPKDNSFILGNFGTYIGDSSEFYSEDGEHLTYDGRTSKTQKTIEKMDFGIQFKKFKKNINKGGFKHPLFSYTFPACKMLLIKK